MVKDEKFIENMRKIVKDYLDIHCYDTALFWADKVNILTKDSLKDFYMFIHCLYCCGQYQRALNLIKDTDLHKRNLLFRYLAAKCHLASKEYEQALETLNWEEINSSEKIMMTCYDNAAEFTLNGRNIEAAINLLRGQIHEQLGCSDAAIECYTSSLNGDVMCYEALQALSSNHMLTPKAENELLKTLPIDKQCPGKEAELVKYIYATKLQRPNKQSVALEQHQECTQIFKENLDILINKAERLYYEGDFESAYSVCRKVLEKDQFHKLCVPLYVSTLVHLNKVTKLFEIAHSLVKQYPQDAVSWFAVGCYYFLIGNMDPARKFFLKATCLNRSFSPAWLALGHSFAQESEHDQATSAYFTSAQIMKGSFLPFLYIGLEYTLSNNLKLAERFYQQALNVECDDPFVLHELGVIWFKSQNYSNAEVSMRRAYNRLRSISHKNTIKEWEPLLNNLGHVCRKLKKYNDSIEFYRKALSLYPTNAATWTSIGLTSIFLNKFDEAIEYFHQALWYKKTDLVAKKLLEKCLNLVKDHSSLTLPEDFHMDITDIMLLKQQQQKSKVKIDIATDVSNSDSISYPVVNKSGHDESSTAMDLVMDSVST